MSKSPAMSLAKSAPQHGLALFQSTLRALAAATALGVFVMTTLAATVPNNAQAQSAPAAQTAPLPPEVRASGLDLTRMQGTGTMRFLGLKIYDAKLWVNQAVPASDWSKSPYALELIYARQLEGKLIAERSIVEMRRVGSLTDAQAKAWQQLMENAFPNVKAGDRLTGVFNGKSGVQFFYNGQLSAETKDAEFARLFFGIWLSPNTSAPPLRNSLLGL